MSDTASSPPDAAETAAGERGTPSFRSVVDDLLKVYTASAGKNASPAVSDAITQALVLALGSGLQTAALDGIAAAQQAQGRMFLDAVERQQRASILALEATAKGIREILSVSAKTRGTEEASDAG